MKKGIILLITVSFLISCKEKRNSKLHIDEFYTNKGEFDFSRIPLIKPYECGTAIPSNNWIIQSNDGDEVLGTIPGTLELNVIDSVIFAHAKKTILVGQLTNEAWFIIIPKNHKFLGFKNHAEYLEYIKSIKVKEPKMYTPLMVFQNFDRRDTLDWKELNKIY